jgi:competence protein ComEC
LVGGVLLWQRPPGPLRRTRALFALCWWAVVAVTTGCTPVTLQEISPTEVAPGTQVRLRGTGFVPGMVARLETETGATVSLSLSDVRESQAVAVLPKATPTGTWDVVVGVEGAEARLKRGLLVRTGTLRVQFLDVGQGDATLILTPEGKSLLIDGGNRDATPVVTHSVRQMTGGVLDVVAVTHTDADHLGGVVGFLRGDDGVAGTEDDVTPKTAWIGHADALCETDLCAEFRALRTRFIEPLVGDVVSLGGARVEVVGRDGNFGEGGRLRVDDENERSLALKVSFAGRSVFIGGDLTGGGLGSANVEALAAGVMGTVDVLRLNHHGSATSSSTVFLDALRPTALIISVGTDNAFCHPASVVLDRLEALSVPVWATGAGMLRDGDRCDDGPTAWPSLARPGQGTIVAEIEATGRLTIDGEER